MPGYGTLGRFSVAGYRRDLDLVSFQPAALILDPVALSPLAGVAVEYQLAQLLLDSPALQPEAGARTDFVPETLFLTSLVYEGLPGSAIDYQLPADIIALVAVVPDPRAGATVNYHLPWATDVLLSTVGAWTVGGGPASYFEQPLRASAPSYAPFSGATVDLIPFDLGLIAVSYEPGARHKPVRGQFFIYG